MSMGPGDDASTDGEPVVGPFDPAGQSSRRTAATLLIIVGAFVAILGVTVLTVFASGTGSDKVSTVVTQPDRHHRSGSTSDSASDGTDGAATAQSGDATTGTLSGKNTGYGIAVPPPARPGVATPQAPGAHSSSHAGYANNANNPGTSTTATTVAPSPSFTSVSPGPVGAGDPLPTVSCGTTTTDGTGAPGVAVSFTWVTTDATSIDIGVDTSAPTAADSGLAASGTATVTFDCSAATHLFTFTAHGAGGTTATLTVTIAAGP
jgi:hypothetical protein